MTEVELLKTDLRNCVAEIAAAERRLYQLEAHRCQLEWHLAVDRGQVPGTTPERTELIDRAIEQYMSGLDFEDMESLLKDYLSDEWQSATFDAQECFIEATGARDLWEAGEEQD